MDIRPKAICRQLFAIREQISGELVNDLRELPRKDNELSKARALYDEDRPSFDESRLGDADGSRASPFRAATYELALQLCTAFAVESILSSLDDRELERAWRAHTRHQLVAEDSEVLHGPLQLDAVGPARTSQN